MTETVFAIPDLTLLLLVGTSGSGKSTFAARHFEPTQVVSSDRCRALVSDDPSDQTATDAAFEVLHLVVRRRLEAGRLTVVDATNLERRSRDALRKIAQESHAAAAAVVFALPPELCSERNAARGGARVPEPILVEQRAELARALETIHAERLKDVLVLRTPEEVDSVRIERVRPACDRRELTGPFDIIGDVHGCIDELRALLTKLGYTVDGDDVVAPPGRTAVFVGDFADRGPDAPAVLRLAMAMERAGAALAVEGNHDAKLRRHLRGKPQKRDYGFGDTLDQLEQEPAAFSEDLRRYLRGLPHHLVLDGGALVVAHAGLPEAMHLRDTGKVRSVANFGKSTGQVDELGYPVRYPWAEEYSGDALVVFGHTALAEPTWVNNTVCLDTGCVFGGALTALRYPEREIVSVPAQRMYYDPAAGRSQ